MSGCAVNGWADGFCEFFLRLEILASFGMVVKVREELELFVGQEDLHEVQDEVVVFSSDSFELRRSINRFQEAKEARGCEPSLGEFWQQHEKRREHSLGAFIAFLHISSNCHDRILNQCQNHLDGVVLECFDFGCHSKYPQSESESLNQKLDFARFLYQPVDNLEDGEVDFPVGERATITREDDFQQRRVVQQLEVQVVLDSVTDCIKHKHPMLFLLHVRAVEQHEQLRNRREIELLSNCEVVDNHVEDIVERIWQNVHKLSQQLGRDRSSSWKMFFIRLSVAFRALGDLAKSVLERIEETNPKVVTPSVKRF